jgi:hypothetical protein
VDACHHPPTFNSCNIIWGEYCATELRTEEEIDTRCLNYWINIIIQLNFTFSLYKIFHNNYNCHLLLKLWCDLTFVWNLYNILNVYLSVCCVVFLWFGPLPVNIQTNLQIHGM